MRRKTSRIHHIVELGDSLATLRKAAVFLALEMVAHQPLAAQTNVTAAAQPANGLLAQQATYTFLGNSRGYDRVPGGIMLRAEHGAVMVEAIAGIGARIRVRFSEGTPSFPTPHSLATGDSAPRLGTAAVRDAGDSVFVSAEGLVVRVAQHPVRLSVTDSAGHELLAESFGAGVWQGRLAPVSRDLPTPAYSRI